MIKTLLKTKYFHQELIKFYDQVEIEQNLDV